MSDILLVNPVDNTHIKNSLGLKVPPLSLMYLAGVLLKSNDVKIIDDNMEKLGYSKISNIASRIDPDIVGLTANTASIKSALGYIKKIKEKLPNALIVLGGPHPTFLPAETLKEGADVVVMGEGEETFAEIAQNSDKLNEIKGIAYRKDDKIKLNPPRPPIHDLDSLPFPARDLLPFEDYVDSGYAGGMITSRGCAFSCNYCSSSLIMGKKFRSRSPQNVVDEIEELVYTYKISDLAFLDDIFMLNKNRARDIAAEIKNRGLDIKYVASSRVNTVNRPLLESLKSSGMSTLYYGVESGSQRVLDLMGKGITLKQAQDAIKITKDEDIDVLASFIIGYPGETSEEIDKTIDFSIKLNPDYSQFSILTPFPGTSIYYELKEKGLLDSENWDKYNALESVINYEKLGLSKGMIERKLTKAYLKFYLRPQYIAGHAYMFGYLLKTLFRSLILPKLIGKSPEGWYNTIN